MSWFTVEKIDTLTFVISEYGHREKVHSYLLMGTEYACLIDTGLGIGNIKDIIDELTDLPVKVITTHVHWDHIGGHNLFCKIYVHKGDAQWLRNGIPLPINIIRNYVSGPVTEKIPEDFNIENYFPYKGEPSGELNDNDIIDAGNRKLRVIHTPGHSPGHICIYEQEKGYLFTGDLIYKGTLFAFYPSTDPVDFSMSVEKICKIEYIKNIFPGHNELMVDRNFSYSVRDGFRSLKENGLLKHGTGLHEFNNFSIKI